MLDGLFDEPSKVSLSIKSKYLKTKSELFDLHTNREQIMKADWRKKVNNLKELLFYTTLENGFNYLFDFFSFNRPETLLGIIYDFYLSVHLKVMNFQKIFVKHLLLLLTWFFFQKQANNEIWDCLLHKYFIVYEI